MSDPFSQLEIKKEDLLETKQSGIKKREDIPPHLIKIPKGTIPSYISLNPYQTTAWKLMGKKATKKLEENPDPKMEEDLLKAHILLRPEEFMATVYLTSLIVTVLCIIMGIVLILISGFEIIFMLIGIGLMVLGPVMTMKLMNSQPSSAAKARSKGIDGQISPAMSFIAAMASADVTIAVIFNELAQRPEYGEIRSEAEWITRDTELLGKDILTALKDASKRSPSMKWEEFLQGVVTTSTSGGRLKPFFVSKAEEFEKDLKMTMRRKMETIGLFAETYVTVGVAFPLFLVIIMAIMALIGGAEQAEGVVMVLYVLAFIMIPAMIVMFIWMISNTTKEV